MSVVFGLIGLLLALYGAGILTLSVSAVQETVGALFLNGGLILTALGAIWHQLARMRQAADRWEEARLKATCDG